MGKYTIQQAQIHIKNPAFFTKKQGFIDVVEIA